MACAATVLARRPDERTYLPKSTMRDRNLSHSIFSRWRGAVSIEGLLAPVGMTNVSARVATGSQRLGASQIVVTADRAEKLTIEETQVRRQLFRVLHQDFQAWSLHGSCFRHGCLSFDALIAALTWRYYRGRELAGE